MPLRCTRSRRLRCTAYRNGFKSDNSFIDFFKKAYGCTPGKFRQQAKESGEKSAAPQEDVADWLQELLQYSDGAPLPVGDAPVLVRKSVQFAEQAACTPIRPSWRKMVNIGYAHDGLIGSVQTQLRRAQEEIGFTGKLNRIVRDFHENRKAAGISRGIFRLFCILKPDLRVNCNHRKQSRPAQANAHKKKKGENHMAITKQKMQTSQETNVKTSVFEKISYGMGDVACNVVFALTSGLITYFYTNVMSVSAAYVKCPEASAGV